MKNKADKDGYISDGGRKNRLTNCELVERYPHEH
jgi:hypothetical protein